MRSSTSYRSPSLKIGSLKTKIENSSNQNNKFSIKNRLKVCESLGLIPIKKRSQTISQQSRFASPPNNKLLINNKMKTTNLTTKNNLSSKPKKRNNQKKSVSKKKLTLTKKNSFPKFLSCKRALSSNTSNFKNNILRQEGSIPKSDFRRNFSNFRESSRNIKKNSKRTLTMIAKSQKQFRPSTWIPNLMENNLSTKIQSPKNCSKKLEMNKKRSPSNIFRKNRAISFNSMNLNPSKLGIIETLPGTECFNEKGSSLGMSLFKESIINMKRPSENVWNNKNLKSKKVFKKNKSNLKSKPILKELVAHLKGNDNLQLEILKSLGCPFKKKRNSLKPILKESSKIKSEKKLEKLKKLNKLITKDQNKVSKIKNELEKSSKKKNNKKKNPEILFEHNFNPVPFSNIYPRTNKQSNLSKIQKTSEPFSLQNNKIGFPSNHINLKPSFNNPLLIVNLKENQNTNPYVPKKTKKKTEILSSTFSKSKTASNFKQVKSLKNSLKTRKKSYSRKKKGIRDEDIKHHMNLIFTNDLNIGKKKSKKNIYLK